MLAQKSETMRSQNDFNIEFVGLKLGFHNFDFEINDTFFKDFKYADFSQAKVDINVDLEKKTTLLKLKISAKGDVMVNCDLTNEPFKLDVENCIDLVVKFGSEFNDEDDEILIVPHGEYKINVAQYIYELIVLSIPAKRIHPGVIDGSLKSEILNILEDLKPNEKKSKVDPRWEKLKELTNKKD